MGKIEIRYTKKSKMVFIFLLVIFISWIIAIRFAVTNSNFLVSPYFHLSIAFGLIFLFVLLKTRDIPHDYGMYRYGHFLFVYVKPRNPIYPFFSSKTKHYRKKIQLTGTITVFFSKKYIVLCDEYDYMTPRLRYNEEVYNYLRNINCHFIYESEDLS